MGEAVDMLRWQKESAVRARKPFPCPKRKSGASLPSESLWTATCPFTPGIQQGSPGCQGNDGWIKVTYAERPPAAIRLD